MSMFLKNRVNNFFFCTYWELHTRQWLLPPRSCSSGNILFTSATIPPHSSLRAFCHLSSSSFVCSGSSASTADQKNVTSPLCSSPPRSLRYSAVQKRPSLCKSNLQERANKRATLSHTGGRSLACAMLQLFGWGARLLSGVKRGFAVSLDGSHWSIQLDLSCPINCMDT